MASISTDLINLIINAEPTGFRETSAQIKELERKISGLAKEENKFKRQRDTLTRKAKEYREAIKAFKEDTTEERATVKEAGRIKKALEKTIAEREKAAREIKRVTRERAKAVKGLQQEQLATKITAQRKRELIEGYINTDITARRLAETNEELNLLMHKREPLSRDEIERIKELVKQQQFLTKQFKGQIPTAETLNKKLLALEIRYRKTGDKMNYYRQGYNLLFSAQQKGVELSEAQKEKMEMFAHKLKQSGSMIAQFARKMFIWAFGWTMAYAGIRSVTRAFTSLFKQASETETAMARVNAVLNITMGFERKFGDLERAVYSYGKTSSMSFKEVADAMYHLATIGLKTSDVMAGFRHELDLAIATQSDLKTTARLVAGAYKLFSDRMEGTFFQAERFRHIVDVLSYAYSQHQVELNEIADAFKYVGGAAGLLDMSFEELVGTIGFLNTHLIRGSRAGTTLLNSFVRLAKDSDKLRREFYIAFDPTRPINFIDIMEQLHERTKDNIDSAETLGRIYEVFGRRAGRGITMILGHYEAWKKAVEELTGSVEFTASKMRTAQEKTFSRQFSILMKQWFSDTIFAIQQIGQEMAKSLSETKEWNVILEKVNGVANSLGIISVDTTKAIRTGMKLNEEDLKNIKERAQIMRSNLIVAGITGQISKEELGILSNIAKMLRTGKDLSVDQEKIFAAMPKGLREMIKQYPELFAHQARVTVAVREIIADMVREGKITDELLHKDKKRWDIIREIENIAYENYGISKKELNLMGDALDKLLKKLQLAKIIAKMGEYAVEEIRKAVREREKELYFIRRTAIEETALDKALREREYYEKNIHDILIKYPDVTKKELNAIRNLLESGKEITSERLKKLGIDLQDKAVIGDIVKWIQSQLKVEKELSALSSNRIKSEIEHKYALLEIVNKNKEIFDINTKLAELREKLIASRELESRGERRIITELEYKLQVQKLLYEYQEEYAKAIEKAKEEIQGPVKQGLMDILDLEVDWYEVAEGGLSKHEQQWRQLGETISNVFSKIGDAWQEKILDRLFSGIDELLSRTKLAPLIQGVQETWATGGRGTNVPTTATIAGGILPLAIQGRVSEGDKKIVNVSVKNSEAIKNELKSQTGKLAETSLLAASYIINALWASTAETIKYNQDGTQTIVKNEAKTGAELGSLAGALTGLIPGIGPAVSAAWTAVGSLLGGLIGKQIETTEDIGDKVEDGTDEIEERLEWIIGKYDDTNKELKIANRNLVAIRNGFEGWIMPSSAYFRSLPRFQGGGIVPGLPSQEVPAILHGQEIVTPAGARPEVTVGSMTININDGKQAEDIIRTIEQEWVIRAKRAYQGV